jgi:hypothetical protein
MNLIDACKLLNIRIFELTEENINKKYRKACLKHHPDKGGDAKLFIKIKDAYEYLKGVEQDTMFRYIRKLIYSLYNYFHQIHYEINPNLEHLLKKDVYYIKEHNLYIPLWHRELIFKNIVIRINPVLPENVVIDSENHIHIYNSPSSYTVKGKGIPMFHKNIYNYSQLSDIIYHEGDCL